MTESFVHYLWQFQRFDKSLLRTTNGDPIVVLKTGVPNTNAGPDFLQARLMIGEMEWVGNVEMHLRASDWNAHQHQLDPAYNNVILHVVWESDRPIQRADGSEIPALELNAITDSNLIGKYELLMSSRAVIPCAAQFAEVSDLTRIVTLDRALTSRLMSKAAVVDELLEENKGDWEETAYQLLAKNFGFKLNSDVFLRLAKNLPLKILQKHRDHVIQTEAMLLGQAGLLSEADEYGARLSKEYDFLAAKFSLKPQQLQAHEWKMMRTRPGNFPTVRMAQLAQLISTQKSFFSLFTQTESIDDLRKALQAGVSAYWQAHYHFGKKSVRKSNGMGKGSADILIINTVIPLLACYAQRMSNQTYMDRAVGFLEAFPAETNHITDMWKNMGLSIRTAFDAQAGIELYNYFCSQKKCLQCPIGVEILKK